MSEVYSVMVTGSITNAIDMQRELIRRIGSSIHVLDRPGVMIKIEEVMLCSCKDTHTVNVIGPAVSEEGAEK